MNDLTQRREMGMRDHRRELKKKCEKEGELKKKKEVWNVWKMG